MRPEYQYLIDCVRLRLALLAANGVDDPAGCGARARDLDRHAGDQRGREGDEALRGIPALVGEVPRLVDGHPNHRRVLGLVDAPAREVVEQARDLGDQILDARAPALAGALVGAELAVDAGLLQSLRRAPAALDEILVDGALRVLLRDQREQLAVRLDRVPLRGE